jgi:flavin reductase (DIM6/NTAB) family NADH-FMN oxidoreductase RutF
MPMPVAIAGTVIDEHPSFFTVSFLGMMNFQPPVISITMGKGHASVKAIDKNKTFSLNIPSEDLVAETDYVGVSDKDQSRSTIFTIFNGKVKNAPFIHEAAINLGCKLLHQFEITGQVTFIAEVTEMFSSEEYITDNWLDLSKIKPFVFTMPDQQYWKIDFSEPLGKAWEIGRTVQSQKTKMGIPEQPSFLDSTEENPEAGSEEPVSEPEEPASESEAPSSESEESTDKSEQ